MSSGEFIIDYARKFANGQISEMGDMLDEHVEYWVQGAGTFGKSEIMAIMHSIISKVESANTEVLDVIEMGSKAAVALKTSFKLKSGVDIVDDLCLVAELSNSRLVRVREYLNQSVMPHFMG